ncbi:APC family permease [Spiroplasma clarkii]|uniref:Amino acid permease n=1 Tax=Spiroplasma clarkii TaxID=2139 RepID=A0A2K8KIZ6_9MOLU|nr:APC family permease [Spiroplasma clarkii]ATX71660.1 amino acid permease [Spiroplasma clarkii]
MIKVNKANKARNKIFEFLTIFSMTFGLVVASGIYLKNRNQYGGVLYEAQNNPWLAIMVWIFIGVVCTLMMVSFVEITGAMKDGEHSTLQSWTKKFINRKSASWIAIFYVAFYMPAIGALGSMFLIDILFEQGIRLLIIETQGKDQLVIALGVPGYLAIKLILSTILLVGFQVMNATTIKPGRWIQTIFTFVKFLPLIVVVIGGIVLYATTPNMSNSFNKSGTLVWGASSTFATMVPILFAFDAFMYAATLQKDVEHREVVAPALLSAILAVTIFYVLITVAIFLGADDGDIFKLFTNIFSNKLNAPWVTFIFKVIIAATLLTMINGYTTLIPKTVQSAVEEELLYLGKKNVGKITIIKAAIIGGTILGAIYITSIIASIIITAKGESQVIFDRTGVGIEKLYVPNPMEVLDLISSTTAVYAFAIYLVTNIAQVVNRFTNKVEIKKVKGGLVCGILASGLVSIVMAYLLYATFIGKPFALDRPKGVSADDWWDNQRSAIINGVASILVLVPIFTWWGINEYQLKKHVLNKEAV